VVVGVVAFALLLGGGIAVARTRHDPARPAAATQSPSPSASEGWTGYPGPPPDTPPDRFAEAVTIALPRRDGVTPVLLPDGTPGFVRHEGSDLFAFGAVAGADPRPQVLGWCAASRTFESGDGTLRFNENGFPYSAETDGLVVYPTRSHEGDETGLDVGIPDPTATGGSTFHLDAIVPPRRCAAGALLLPGLPPAAQRLGETANGPRLIHGRYLVGTDRQAFCPGPPPGPGCGSTGWEVVGLTVLDPSDLAEEYTYEGDFVVRADPSDGRLTIDLLPNARLVRRTGVGRSAECGKPALTVSRGVTRLHLGTDPASSATHVDTVRALRSDVAFYLGNGRTGLGRPHATADSLRQFIADQPDATVCAVLDARRRVMRVVAEAVYVEPVMDPVPPLGSPSPGG
jgi:hypothetical protein